MPAEMKQPCGEGQATLTTSAGAHECEVALLSGGGDRPYAFGLAMALISIGMGFDLIGSDEVDSPEFRGRPGVTFLNLRGNSRQNANFLKTVSRLLAYYIRLIRYAATARPKVFHILWNNKFEFFDRTLLLLYYKLLGKKIVLTVHNVNAGARDSSDTRFNRLTLRVQYRLADRMFVHTEQMKNQLVAEFGVRNTAVTVIPFGINNAVPNTELTSDQAKQRLGIRYGERTLLFFGNVAPYKGLHHLIAGFQQIVSRNGEYRLIIAGRVKKGCEKYWHEIQGTIRDAAYRRRIILKIEYIPDEEVELYFKAADVLVLPYTHIFQSGVLFLGYSFGLPVIAADVGTLREDIVEGNTGFVCEARDPVSLAKTIEAYFASDLYKSLNNRRQEIRDYVKERHSWEVVAQMTRKVYAELLGMNRSKTKRACTSEVAFK